MENAGLFATRRTTTLFEPRHSKIKSLGDWSGEGTPGNIPNPVVKVASADGTWGATPWESRSLPRDFYYFPLPGLVPHRPSPQQFDNYGRVGYNFIAITVKVFLLLDDRRLRLDCTEGREIA